VADTGLHSSTEPLTRSLEEARELGLRAIELAPDWPVPHFTLWSLCRVLGRHDEAEGHLRSVLQKGGIPVPLVDYNYNTLVSAEPEAIIFTNGDNDTYPPLALQATHGTRTDVAIVNLSILNRIEYALSVWEETFGKGAPFTRRELQDLHDQWKQQGKKPLVRYSTMVMRALLDKVREGEWTKPVYFAITVARTHLDECDQALELEGLINRVKAEPKRQGEDDGCVMNVAKTHRLFRDEFRLDSATDLAYPWSRESAITRIMQNYPAVLRVLATEAGERGDLDVAAFALRRAIRILDYHGQTEMVKKLAKYWKELDPSSREMDPWL
jgi:hypothetical protein